MTFDPLALVRPEVRALRPYVAGRPIEQLERELGITHAVRLSANENPLGPSPLALEALARAATGANRYPDGGGSFLRRRLARELAVEPEMLALGNGSNELIELLVHLFVGPGDEVVFSDPTFLVYGIAVRMLGGTPVAVPGRGLEHDLDAMLAAIGPRTKVIIVCNPNNPTGALVGSAAWTRFLDRVPPGVVVVSDEAYHEYVEDPDQPRTIDDLARDRPLVILRTFSKIHSLAGLRVGYAIAHPGMAALFDRVRIPFNVNAPAQAAAAAALDDPDHVARSRAVAREGKALLLAALPALGIVAHPSHGNFVLADLGRPARPVCAALQRRGIVLRDLVAFGMAPNFVRVTIGTAEENQSFLAALEAVLGEAAAGVA